MAEEREDKPTQEDEEEHSPDRGATGGNTEETSREPTLADLAGMFQAHMLRQEARDAVQEQRYSALKNQFQQLQLEVQAHTPPGPEHAAGQRPDLQAQATVPPEGSPGGATSGRFRFSPEPRLEKLTENDDIEHFLITFEKISAACRWPKDDLVFHLIPLLTGKARSAYVHMDVDETHDYENVKNAILRKYDINPETYRQRFRNPDVEPGETPKELYVRLKELYQKWVRPKDKTVKDVGEMIILEQYLRMLSPELQIWIKEHDPPSAAEAASLADMFVAARRPGQPWSYSTWRAAKDNRQPFSPQYHQNATQSGGKAPFRENQPINTQTKQANRVPTCYVCGQEGHIKPNCPQNPLKLTQMCVVPRRNDSKTNDDQNMKMATVKVNGKTLKALIDTGSDQTLVHRKFVPPNIICTLETIPICCVHGDKKPYPTADMYLEVEGQTYLLNIGVSGNLPFPVVLGSDLPVLFDLLRKPHSCNVAVTRAQVGR